MRILTAATEAPNGGRRLSLGEVSPGLAPYAADSVEEGSAIAGLLSELLLGSRDERWTTSHPVDGEAQVRSRFGDLVLKRLGGRTQPRLTLAPLGPRPTDAPAAGPRDWQADLEPGVIASVFFAGTQGGDPLRPLLSVRIAEAFTRLVGRRRAGASAIVGSLNPQPTNELLRRRDELAGRIEALFATRREESVELDERITGLDSQRAELLANVEELRRRVRSLAEQIDTEGARVRYEELTRVAAEAEGRQAADEWAPRVEELDEEVSRWRSTLAELESRESYVRGELARVRPDDEAPQLLLADQRSSIAVAQRLVADLESEVARFARSGGSPLCVCSDAHPRLNPLVETLGRHVDRLAGLITQQDQALRTQELLSEAAQLERSQAELRRQLDHLLERRQTLYRSSRARTVRTERGGYPIPHAIDSAAIERDHSALAEQLVAAEAELETLDRQRHDAIERRRRMLDGGQLAAWQSELASVQDELARVGDLPAEPSRGSLRASDVLARLTDGEFTELRLAQGGRAVEVRDRTGRIVRQADLTVVEQRLVAWALRLALADACHEADVPLPMVLDQPFLELDDRHAANLATCLDDYARRGRQVVLFAREGVGIARFRGLGVKIRSFGEPITAPVPRPSAPAREPQTRTVVREESVTRAWLLDVEDPIERFPVPLAQRDKAFARSRVRTIGDLISGDPSAIAEEIAIEGVTAELVALWQAHLALVCFTPGLDLQAAKLLVECDILTVDQLSEADAEHLTRALRKRGASESMFRRVEEWVEGAADGVGRWKSSGYSKSWRRNRRERRDRIRDNASRRSAGGSSLRLSERSDRDGRDSDRGERRTRRRRSASSQSASSSRSGSSSSSRSSRSERTERSSSSRSEKKTLRFYLEVESDVEAAPSIGPKRAAQLTALGVATVADLLACDPEAIAAGLDDNRVDAATIVAWQHQSGLMCAVPGLRGHDSQVLVGSGFASAEEIAAMKPADLLEFVDPFCDTPEGQRALRGSARPDLAEVTEWVQGARQRRAVGVA